jgi:hypothetical protein
MLADATSNQTRQSFTTIWTTVGKKVRGSRRLGWKTGKEQGEV